MGKYSKDFKLSAITAFLERGQGYRHIGARFGLDPTLLRRWVAASISWHYRYRYYNHDRIKMQLGGLSPVAYRAQAQAA